MLFESKISFKLVLTKEFGKFLVMTISSFKGLTTELISAPSVPLIKKFDSDSCLT